MKTARKRSKIKVNKEIATEIRNCSAIIALEIAHGVVTQKKEPLRRAYRYAKRIQHLIDLLLVVKEIK